ncbi:uncharacterized protein LOC110825326 [Carica papaya]|uniref:uncharacterized protein LOC110825326 n=1 Tax=Carica papaya TaxID=3649 RepID=UPI000B8C94BC|nr:uncharacterized protein LOC110825326 [Carica papaya]
MEEDQEMLKHSCKFCNKSFPCGRSLGGHMRSHMNNEDKDFAKQKLSHDNPKIKKSSVTEISSFGAGSNSGYVLRENPKKTWRLTDHSSEETSVHLLHDKFCRECGKGFQSWKALFGHMKCHSEKEKLSINGGDNTSLDGGEQESWASANQKLVMDSQSDNEAAGPPSRSRRSKRRIGTAANSSSVSEVEQEQEEVAMCLMMLSRDVSNWAGLNSVAESSDNNSVFLETKLISGNGDEKLKKKVNQKVMESSTVEYSASGFSRIESRINRNQISSDGFSKIDEKIRKRSGLGLGQVEAQLGCSAKKSFLDFAAADDDDGGDGDDDHYPDSLKKSTSDHDVSDSELLIFKDSKKRSKFKCTTCDKIFQSYQALGGHRASHKKTRGCFSSTIDTNENTINETHHHLHHHYQQQQKQQELSPIKSTRKETKTHQSVPNFEENNKAKTKKSKGHECPICLKVFQSGQALGGHKRSHLLVGTETKSNQTIVIEQKPAPKIREFLDLNLPAPVEDETGNNNNAHAGFEQWWMRSSHKLGLISN